MTHQYQWTADGEVEYGTVEKQTADGDTTCYHCGCEIKKNETITLFQTSDEAYVICGKCSSELFGE